MTDEDRSKEAPRRKTADVGITTLSDGRLVVFPVRPGVVLDVPPVANATGVCDLAWIQAWRLIGAGYHISPYQAGWPRSMDAGASALLQFPPDGIEPGTDACRSNNDLQSWCYLAFFNRHGPDYKVTPHEFLAWLREQGQAPSRHIIAWCKANGVQIDPQPEPQQDAAAPAPRGTPPQQAKRQRSDLLAPLVERAMREAGTESADVFNLLRKWAREKPPRAPLLGADEAGIQWLDAADQLKNLSLRVLSQRIKRAVNHR